MAAAPLVAWEIFSLVYFGFPLPNTAYAKLGTGIAASALAQRGWRYLEATLRRDPRTFVVIAAGLVLVLAAGLLAPRNPVLAPVMPPFETWFRGVADERGYYHPGTGLLARLRPGFVEHEYITAGRRARAIMETRGDPSSWRIGHFERELPPGYRETIAGGRNVIADPALAWLYDDVRLVTTGPLFGRERWGAIVRLNLGTRGR